MSVSPQDMCEVKTSGYKPPVGYRPLFTQMGLPPFTLNTIEWMQRDPQVRLSMAIKTAPYHKILCSLKGDPVVVKFMADQIRRFWSKALPKVLRGFWYTMAPGEIVLRQNHNQLEFWSLEDCHPLDVNILHSRSSVVGISIRAAGFNATSERNSIYTNAQSQQSNLEESVKLFFPKGFLYIHDREYGSLQGRSDFEAAYPPWVKKNKNQGAVDSRDLWFYKNAFNGGIMFHPPGSYQTDDGDKIPYADIARTVVEKAVNGSVMTVAQRYNDKGEKEWEYQQPEIHAGGVELLNYVKDLDNEISRGMGIPDDVFQQVSDGGSRAGRSIPLMAFFTSQEEKLDNLFTVVDQQVFRNICKMNFGHDDYEASVDIDIDRLMGVVNNGEVGSSGNPKPGLSPEDHNERQNAETKQMSFSSQKLEEFVNPKVRFVLNGQCYFNVPIQMSNDNREPAGSTHTNRSGKRSRGGQFVDRVVKKVHDMISKEVEFQRSQIRRLRRQNEIGHAVPLVRQKGNSWEKYDPKSDSWKPMDSEKKTRVSKKEPVSKKQTKPKKEALEKIGGKYIYQHTLYELGDIPEVSEDYLNSQPEYNKDEPYETLRDVHRRELKKAIKAGKKIPEGVLYNYLDLRYDYISAQREKNGDTHGKTALNVALRSLGHADLPEKTKQIYEWAWKGSLTHMSPSARKMLDENLSYIQFFPNNQALHETYKSMHPQAIEDLEKKGFNGNIAGWASSPFDGGKGTLALDGDSDNTFSPYMEAKWAVETYSHEIAHNIDPYVDPEKSVEEGIHWAIQKDENDQPFILNRRHSGSKEWVDAWESELKGGQLSKYGGTSPIEGFAEFGRAVFCSWPEQDEHARSFGQTHSIYQDHFKQYPEGVVAEMKKKYPKSFAYFEKVGYI